MAFAHFLKEFSSGFPFAAYLLHSADHYLLYEAFARIRDASGGDAFNFDAFDGDAADSRPPMDTIIDTLNTLPFAASRRTVIIRNLQKYQTSDHRKIEAYVSRPSPSSLLLMLCEGKIPKSMENLIPPKVRRISLTIPDQEIVPFIIERGRQSGLEIDGKTAEYLISLVGSELGALCSEIEKLSTLGKPVLSTEEMQALVYSDITYTAFDLASALDRGDARKALIILDNLAGSSEAQMVLGALNWHYGNLWRKGGKDPAIALEIFRLLHQADAAVKTSHQAVLEDLICRLLRLTQIPPQKPWY